MLSFDRGTPVAQVNDPRTPDHGKIIHVLPAESSQVSELKVQVKNPVETLGIKFFKFIPRIRSQDLAILNACLKEGIPPLRYPHLLDGYNRAVEALNGSAGKEIRLFGKGILFPIYDPDAKRECDYVSGISGAGKSTYAAARAEQWLYSHPDGKVFMFSELKEDPAFDHIPLTRILINDELLDPENPVRPEEFKDSLVIFDDIDAIIEPKLLKAVRKIRDRILSIGRHDNISVISTTHLLCNGHETKGPLQEATSVTVFPQSGNGIDNMRLYFSKKCGLPKVTVDKILSTKSRWVTHRKTYPNCIVYEHGAYLL